MPDFANFLEPPPPPSSPAALPLISRSIIDAGDPNSKPPSKLGSRDSDPQLKSECPNPKPDEQCNELDTELNYKSDSTIEHQDSDLSSEPELRVVHREDEVKCQSNGEIRVRGCQRDIKRFATANKSLDEFVKDWVTRSVKAGVPEHRCFLPFLSQAPKSVECPVCQNLIFPGEDLSCSVRGCQVVVHQLCAIERLGFSSTKQFKCPQHVCFACNKMNHIWRCIKCLIASHDKCAAFPEYVVHLTSHPGRVICWKHHPDWRLEKEHEDPIKSIEEIFTHLPLPYMEEEFKINLNWKDANDGKLEPPSYEPIKRNVYLIKKKRDNVGADIGCTNCSSTKCSDSCICRVQSISCSKACRCSGKCSNRPFREEKKIKLVKTELCGWGVVAAESIKKGDFIIEYIGEVIDDALCEKRLWQMKYSGEKNFYMCEIRKDFTIDATFKGNYSRFLNHSCDPNCKLEKWLNVRHVLVFLLIETLKWESH
ncbi:histone-lysine N-methyltransferase ASHR3 isoform X2 [Ipomoea triloba]|uniref:histone-lysine N-methyltransferase ASHR3 isoform X2 n=1 Tax=Ipomoea triloba TaxID=35885 RepID=UPI00125D0DF9|nr:histone-lysine N-methyltransferase ASHR3 isoform X2 [Ipomoea triloba]